VVGLDRVGALLKVVGRVLPMTAEPLDIEATFIKGGEPVDAIGQVAVATTPGRLQELRMKPENPTTRPEVLAAIAEADWITMGPGSWFSSVLPHLLVPSLREALVASPAKKILLLNLDASSNANSDEASAGEYAGYSPLEHCSILHDYAPELHFDLVVADSHLTGRQELMQYLKNRRSGYLEADLRDEKVTIHHGGEKLASTFSHILNEMLV